MAESAESIYPLTRKFLGSIDQDDLVAAARLAEARQDLAGRQATAWGELTAAERADATARAWAWLLSARNAGLLPASAACDGRGAVLAYLRRVVDAVERGTAEALISFNDGESPDASADAVRAGTIYVRVAELDD